MHICGKCRIASCQTEPVDMALVMTMAAMSALTRDAAAYLQVTATPMLTQRETAAYRMACLVHGCGFGTKATPHRTQARARTRR